MSQTSQVSDAPSATAAWPEGFAPPFQALKDQARRNAPAQAMARRLGCAWAGGSDEAPPEPLDAAILFAPVGALVPAALAAVRKGGVAVCGGIHMSDIPSFPYARLWEVRRLVSVANLTRQDGRGSTSCPSRGVGA